MFNDDIFEPLLLESNALHHSAMGGGMFDRGEVEIYNHFIWHKFDGKNGIMEWADKMADNPQNHIQKLTLGHSWENRELFVFKFEELTGAVDPPKIFMDCGMHAREWISPAFCQYFVDQLANPTSEFAYLRKGIEWHIMPMVNPDGYEFTHTDNRLWRKNKNPNTGAVRFFFFSFLIVLIYSMK
jgi:hypothetical protein